MLWPAQATLSDTWKKRKRKQQIGNIVTQVVVNINISFAMERLGSLKIIITEMKAKIKTVSRKACVYPLLWPLKKTEAIHVQS